MKKKYSYSFEWVINRVLLPMLPMAIPILLALFFAWLITL